MTTSPFRERCARLFRRFQQRVAAPPETVRGEPAPRALSEPTDRQELESWENEGGAGARRAQGVDPRAPAQSSMR